jgi:hypothetical protein
MIPTSYIVMDDGKVISMWKKALLTSFLACGLVFTASVPAMPVANASVRASSYHFTYKLPPNLHQLVTLTSIKNPYPEELKKTHQYHLGSYFEDCNGGYASEKVRGALEVWETEKVGFLFALYDLIGGMPPVYPPGYNPEEMNRRIAEAKAKSDAYFPYTKESYDLHLQRGEIEMRARVQALIDAGFVLEEEVEGERIKDPATKAFVANVLYRAWKEVRPYKGSVAPLDTQDEAVRWAIEVGLPGFDVDQRGNVYPHVRLQMAPGPIDVVGGYPYTLLFMYLQTLLPTKWSQGKWEYHQIGGADDSICAECFIFVNGQPYIQYVAKRPNLQNDQGFTRQFEQTKAKLLAASNARIWQEQAKKRQDVMKPRVWDWRRDLIQNPRFAPLIARYRKTHSSQALIDVYQALKNQYHLFPRQDSAAVIKSVLDRIK